MGISNKKLVTGAFGFIGWHLCMELLRAGHQVVAVDLALHSDSHFKKSELQKFENVEILEGDLSDPNFCQELPDISGIYHLAALNGTKNFYDRPMETLTHSTIPTINLLNRYRQAGLQFFFYAGSSESYASTITNFNGLVPTPEEIVLSIDDPKNPRWSYGASKLHGEVASFAAASQYGVPVIVGRFHNAYGPYMGIDHVIPDFIKRGIDGVFELYGHDQTRSFIYIDDAIECVIKLSQSAIGEIVNIGSPTEITITTLAETIMKVAGWDGKIIKHDAPSGSVTRRAPSIEKLKNYIDVTKFKSLEDGLKITLESYV